MKNCPSVQNSISNLTLLLIVLFCLFLNTTITAQTPFKHTTSSSNIKGHMTTLDNPSVNGKSNALLFISQQYGKYNKHQVGVWYSGGKWLIYNEDKAAMPQSTAFNVIALSPSDVAFSHRATTSNIAQNWTVIDHPKTNNNPNAVILVTQNWKGTYNPKAIGVWYTRGKWAIFNQDKSAMPSGANFNVLVASSSGIRGAKTSILTANSATKRSSAGKHVAISDYSNKGNLLFATQNWQSAGVYNNHIISTWKTNGEWSVYNQDRAEIPNNAKFNLLVVPTVTVAPNITNGYNVTYVDFSQNGKRIGRFIEALDKNWMELQDNGKRFNFTELNRDEWSVYLKDASRNVFIQLDLHTKEIYYGQGSFANKSPIYAISNVSRKVNGRMATGATYTNQNKVGKFVQTGADKWLETNVDGTKYSFTETGRDDWSVYMKDASRNVAIQLDYHTMEVKYGKIGAKKTVLYKITGAK